VLVFGIGMIAVLRAGLGGGRGARWGIWNGVRERGWDGRSGGGKLRELGGSVIVLLPSFCSKDVENVAEIFPRVGYGLDL
jgi:hypothetical protein